MTAPIPLPYTHLLEVLERSDASAGMELEKQLSPDIARLILSADEPSRGTSAAASLASLLKARMAVMQAAFDSRLVADELRRYQKFAKPGKPEPHIVQLRRKQAAARQASSVARQSLIRAATVFVRDTGLDVPPRVGLDVFITGWMDANLSV
ncbi:hypothetical protein RKE25_20640 [Dyella sp. BiH032]|uniref:hypothetical protein n=1 Tax=Dyella sp. BiH032 TaxID=3075430 RepID=UPI002893335B|nr:hypothetical protein [Dyella sp. BiH032]WNL45790.1 hypothetical protein RKE25_20640 [Dyella sp. BiH032]